MVRLRLGAFALSSVVVLLACGGSSSADGVGAAGGASAGAAGTAAGAAGGAAAAGGGAGAAGNSGAGAAGNSGASAAGNSGAGAAGNSGAGGSSAAGSAGAAGASAGAGGTMGAGAGCPGADATGRVRLASFAPVNATVDVCLLSPNAPPIGPLAACSGGGALSYSMVTGQIAVPPGDYTARAVLGGDCTAAGPAMGALKVDAGVVTTIVVLDEGAPSLVALQNEAPPTDGSVALRFVNASARRSRSVGATRARCQPRSPCRSSCRCSSE